MARKRDLATAGALPSQVSRTRDVVTRTERSHIIGALNVALRAELDGRELAEHKAGSLASKDSAHDVFMLRTGQRDDERKREVLAIKRFRRHEKALGQLAAMENVRARGFDTLEPFGRGIYVVDGVGSLVVTKYMPSFTTMNQFPWRDFYSGQTEYSKHVVPVLEAIGQHVGHLHSAGIIHHDLQLKNIGRILPDTFITFDLEGAEFFNPLEDGRKPSFEQEGKMIDEFGVLTRSFVDRGFLWTSTDEQFRGEITDNLYLPYLDQVRYLGDRIMEGIDQTVEGAIEFRHRVHSGMSQAFAD